ncbi:MAG: alginate export family protein [Bacteroidales bacterium]|nr:alginate export family protein [Bacteroidales bacterium]
MRIKSTLFTFCLILITGLAIGQTVQIDGEIRPRAEFKNGYKLLPKTDADAAFSVSQRSRFNALYSSNLFKVYISAQDIRVWGDIDQLDKGDYNRFALHQAWGEYFFNENISLKVGRQELVYDDSRIFGNVGWAQQARAHDIALFKIENEKVKAHLGLAFNQKTDVLFGTDYYASFNDGVYTMNSNYKNMQFLWLHTKVGKAGLSILALNNGVESLVDATNAYFKTIYSQTIGARFTPQIGFVKMATAIYYQTGKVINDATDLSALYYAFEASAKANTTTTLTAGFEYLSGTSLKDKIDNPNEIKSFTPLYGTNHKFNGHMDYFFVGNHNNTVGLIDIYATVKVSANKWSFFATPHYFLAAAEVNKSAIDNYATMDKSLGLEIDMGITYAADKNMNFQMGLSEMFGTETLGYLQGNTNTNSYNKNGTWVYLMLSFNPNFYTSK